MDTITNIIYKGLVRDEYSSLQQSKLRYGIRVFLTNLLTVSSVFMAALLLDVILPTLVAILAFTPLRHVAMGYHFRTLTQCVIMSVVAFPVMVKAMLLANLHSSIAFILFVISMGIVLWLGPCATAKNAIINENHRKYLRKQIFIRSGIVVIAFVFIPIEWKLFVSVGVFILSILLTLQKIKNRR